MLMAKTVGGVVRLEGPLSPDTLPLHAFIITAEGGRKKRTCVTLKTNYKHCPETFMLPFYCMSLSGGAKIIMHEAAIPHVTHLI